MLFNFSYTSVFLEIDTHTPFEVFYEINEILNDYSLREKITTHLQRLSYMGRLISINTIEDNILEVFIKEK